MYLLVISFNIELLSIVPASSPVGVCLLVT